MEDYVIYGYEAERAPENYVKLEDLKKALQESV